MSLLTNEELAEIIRVYHQYNMSFPKFVKFASTRIPQGSEYDHLFMLGIHMLDKDRIDHKRKTTENT